MESSVIFKKFIVVEICFQSWKLGDRHTLMEAVKKHRCQKRQHDGQDDKLETNTLDQILYANISSREGETSTDV